MKAILFFLLFPICLSAQKRLEKIYDLQDITGVYINSDAIFKIKVTAKPVQEISVYTIIEGETFESALLHTAIVNQRLEIATGRLPDYTPFNDKLSAHKVLSIELEIVIPQNLDIDIRSSLAEVSLLGDYKDVAISLGRGGFMGNGLRFRKSVIHTISGNITATITQATITAGSRNGTVQLDSPFNAGPSCVLQSIYGDIEVLQVK